LCRPNIFSSCLDSPPPHLLPLSCFFPLRSPLLNVKRLPYGTLSMNCSLFFKIRKQTSSACGFPKGRPSFQAKDARSKTFFPWALLSLTLRILSWILPLPLFSFLAFGSFLSDRLPFLETSSSIGQLIPPLRLNYSSIVPIPKPSLSPHLKFSSGPFSPLSRNRRQMPLSL